MNIHCQNLLGNSFTEMELTEITPPQVELLFEPFAGWLNYQLSPYVAEITERDLIPTYAFPILYQPSGHVAAHRDVADNYYSLTYSVRSSMPHDDLRSGLVFVDSPSNNVTSSILLVDQSLKLIYPLI